LGIGPFRRYEDRPPIIGDDGWYGARIARYGLPAGNNDSSHLSIFTSSLLCGFASLELDLSIEAFPILCLIDFENIASRGFNGKDAITAGSKGASFGWRSFKSVIVSYSSYSPKNNIGVLVLARTLCATTAHSNSFCFFHAYFISSFFPYIDSSPCSARPAASLMERREEGREGKGRVERVSTICLDFESPEKETTNRTASAILDDIGVFGPCVCVCKTQKKKT